MMYGQLRLHLVSSIGINISFSDKDISLTQHNNTLSTDYCNNISSTDCCTVDNILSTHCCNNTISTDYCNNILLTDWCNNISSKIVCYWLNAAIIHYRLTATIIYPRLIVTRVIIWYELSNPIMCRLTSNSISLATTLEIIHYRRWYIIHCNDNSINCRNNTLLNAVIICRSPTATIIYLRPLQ